MKVAVGHTANRQWGWLMLAGAIIIVMMLALQGVLAAAEPGAAQDAEGAALSVLSGFGGSRIGLSIEDLDQEHETDQREGAYVRHVRDESPAERAGFEDGDVVVEFDGERVRSARQLSRLVRETPTGRQVAAVVMREGDRRTLEVTPESGAGRSTSFLPDDAQVESMRRNWTLALPDSLRDLDFSYGVRGPRRLGIEGSPVRGQLADYFGVDEGVLVTSVGDGTPAAAAGLRAGDVITALDGDTVDGLGTLRRRLAGVEPGLTFDIDVTRDGEAVTLEARLGDDTRRVPRRRETI